MAEMISVALVVIIHYVVLVTQVHDVLMIVMVRGEQYRGHQRDFKGILFLFFLSGYHWLETKVKMRLMGLSGPDKVQPLSEQKAVDVGAELLGESLIFGIATVMLVFEYRRGQRKEETKEDLQNQKIIDLQNQVKELELTLETNSAQVRELTRLVHGSLG